MPQRAAVLGHRYRSAPATPQHNDFRGSTKVFMNSTGLVAMMLPFRGVAVKAAAERKQLAGL
jgi:hypothetical protein